MSIRKEYNNRIEWRNTDGYLHRIDGPAIEWASGDKYWYLNDKFHRVDGPAVEWADGNKYWYLNGKRHRVDGPAIEYADGDKAWYLNGQYLSEQDWKKEVLKIRLGRLITL